MKEYRLPVRNRTFSLTILALFCALAIAASRFENSLPATAFAPPGAKPGLSNVIVMFVIVFFNLPSALFVAVLKSAFVLLTKGATAFLCSLFGGLLSATVMGGLSSAKRNPFSLIGVGVAGALAHNAAQLVVACIVTSQSALYYLPALTIFSVVSGSCSGLAAKTLIPKLISAFKALQKF